jgi:hypothetical protein
MSFTLAILIILAVIAVLFLVTAGNRGTLLGRSGGTTRIVERDVAEPPRADTRRVVEREVIERDIDDPNRL